MPDAADDKHAKLQPRKIAREALRRFNTLLGRRDKRLSRQFARNAILAGSEASDLSRGRKAIATHLDALFRDARTIQFDWKDVRSGVIGDAVWLFADGELVLTADGTEKRSAYQLSGVLAVNPKGAWKWRLFHGAEPKT